MDSIVQIPPCLDEARPLWSVLIPCFNCADFLRFTLEAVLDQDPGAEFMEIIVVDDCSTRDDPQAVVDKLGHGRVRFLRQPTNVGKVLNYETGLLASRGRLIHQLHGDDVVLPGFYQAMAAAFDAFPEAAAFFCESDYIDESGAITGRTGRERRSTGILESWLPRIASAQLVQTPSMVVRREIYETLGGFDRRLDCSEDWEMWIRIANQFPVGFCSEARAQYRTTVGNNSTRSILNGKRGRVQRKMFEIVDSYLPADVVQGTQKVRARGQALFFADQVAKVMRLQGFHGWQNLCREVLRHSADPFVVRRLLSLTIRELLK
jgi:glycosyltransferase involved in cell wall biosynthesis